MPTEYSGYDVIKISYNEFKLVDQETKQIHYYKGDLYALNNDELTDLIRKIYSQEV